MKTKTYRYVQNTAFVQRGAELERFEDFCARLKKRFPKAEILNYAKTINDELKEESGQKIQVYPIKPIISTEQHSTHHFEHLRSFKNDQDSNNGIEGRWVERRIFTVTDSFPSISRYLCLSQATCFTIYFPESTKKAVQRFKFYLFNLSKHN